MLTLTTYDLLAKNLSGRADHPAVIAGAREVTYAELAHRCEALAAWMHEQGVKRGDRVGIHLRKSIEEIVATFAVARLGAVIVNLNSELTLRQVEYSAQDCGIRFLFADSRRAEEIAQSEALDRFERIIVVGKAPDHPKMIAWDELPVDGQAPPSEHIDLDLAMLMYTSGSTGKPKGVMLSHRSVVLTARAGAIGQQATPEHRLMGLPPLSSILGTGQMTIMFLVGGTLVLPAAPIPAEIMKTIVDKEVVGMAAVPATWIQILEYLREARPKLPSLRYIMTAGSKLSQAVQQELAELLPGVDVHQIYGTTETGRTTSLTAEFFAEKAGSIGRAGPNVEVFVVDEEKGICGPGELGELITRGNSMMLGYWGQPEATAEKIKVCEHLRPLIGEEKVFFSGDIVKLDEDGFLWFVGRADSLIKCSGYRISPTEVEELVHESGLVGDVVAFGVQDERLGQVVHVAAAPREGGDLDVEALERHCRKNMPNYMVPRRIHVWPGNMPRVGSGKIDLVKVVEACNAKAEEEEVDEEVAAEPATARD